MKFKFIVSLVLAGMITIGCTHNPAIPDPIPVTTTVTLTPTCATCPSGPVCAVTDDIILNSSTTYTACAAQPANQGSFQLDENKCMIWTPAAGANEIVNTCIVVCTGTLCDTTLITIFPPVPDDTMSTGIPCNPGVVYFFKDVLPVLTANCAYSGCHNAASAREGVVLDSYSRVLKTVKAGNPGSSKLYKSITENDADDVMPPSPSPRLTTAQINLIYKWIAQGAKDEQCDENPGGCITTNVSYANFVRPALASCTTCHKTGNAGGGINLDSYQGFKSAADSGRLYGSIQWLSGYQTMPQGGSKLTDCTVMKVKSWIDAGAPNN